MKRFLLMGFLMVIFLIVGCVSNEYYSSRAHVEEFNELNKCQSDLDCVIGQEDVGTDLPSPEPQCVTKDVIDRFDNWFESKNQEVISRTSCYCNTTTNKCITMPSIKQTALCKGTARCFDGTITRIVDGDTIEVDNISIRLAMVDTPDYNEEGWNEAKEFVSSICPVGSTARVDEDDEQTEGSYGRIVAVVYCNKITLNAELITNGYATIDQRFCDVSEFANEYWAKEYGC